MAIPEELVASVVADVSQHLSDPQYTQVVVGRFVQSQPHVSQFFSARASKIGGEAVIHAVFHAEIVSECFRRHHGRSELPSVGFPELDMAAGGDGDSLSRLTTVEPALANYLATNVEQTELGEVIALVGIALHAALE